MGDASMLPRRTEKFRMDGILAVTSRQLYDHGSRAGVMRYFIYELRGVIRDRDPLPHCYFDLVAGPMRLFDLKTHKKG
jgi:hypothetical protein